MSPYERWPFLSDPAHPTLSAVWAVFIHGVIGVIVLAPLIDRSPRPARMAALAIVVANAVDLDHVVAAASLSPQALEHLDGRPGTHSLTFACALAALVGVVTGRRLLAWSLFALLVSHLLYDGAGGHEAWLYPLAAPDAIPWIAVPLGIATLTACSWGIARRAGNRAPPLAQSAPGHLRAT